MTHETLIEDRFEVSRSLWRGYATAVFLAYDRVNEQMCVLKTCHDDYLPLAAARAVFRGQTAQWLRVREHPHLLAAQEVLLDRDRHYVKTEYIPPDDRGRTSLQDHLDTLEAPLDTSVAICWGIELCHAMEHAFRCGVNAHGDIKPANVLITPRGTARLIDFSVPRGKTPRLFKHAQHHRGMMSFTRAYASPEVCRGDRPNQASDIYSFGVVLWQMLTGHNRPPSLIQNADQRHCVRASQTGQTTPASPTLLPALDRVVQQCLAFDPDERDQNFKQLRSRLEAIYEGLTGTVLERPMTLQPSASFWKKRAMNFACIGEHEETVAACNHALRLAPQDGTVWSLKGRALTHLGHADQALTCLEQALRLCPGNAAIWADIGRVHVLSGHPYWAMACYDLAAELDPDDPCVWFRKGTLLHCLGRWPEAIACYDRALQLDPHDKHAYQQRRLAWLETSAA